MPAPIARWDSALDAWVTDRIDLFSERSAEFSETWPSCGSMRNGSVYAPRTSALLMSGSACSSSPGQLIPTPLAADAGPRGGTTDYGLRDWSRSALLPTPTVQEANRSLWVDDRVREGNPGQMLTSAVGSLLPTPMTSDAKAQGPADGARNSPQLRAVDHLLPTPRATDGTNGGPNQRGSSGDLMLPSAVQLLPTPTAAPYGSNQSPSPGAAVRPSLDSLAPTLMPTPRAGADRTSRSAATRRDSMSAPSLGQAVEIAEGILPREFTSWEELPPSWHGDRTDPPSHDGRLF